MKNILIILMVVSFSATLLAQDGAAGGAYNTGSVYLYSGTLASAEQLKIKAYIWGQVRNPGLYIVPDNTDLLDLISSAGGPTENAKLSKIRIVRPTAEGEKIKWVYLKEYIESGNYDLIPILQPGDTVIVSGTIYYAFQKMAQFLSQVAIVLSVYSALSNL
jgi:polysaccharide biosynthesis/export protein